MNAKSSAPSDASITVPRDRDLDAAETSRRELTPAPDTVNARDEDYASAQKSLPPGSGVAEALHARPPRGEDQLEVGSAGDAARPGKTGIVNPALPPRGQTK